MFSKNGRARGDLRSVVEAQTELQGKVVGRGVLEVRGRVTGEIEYEGTVIVAAGAICVAGVRADQVVLAGEVRGDVHVTGKLEIDSTGRLHGEALCGTLVIRAGGALNGRSRMHQCAEEEPEDRGRPVVTPAPAFSAAPEPALEPAASVRPVIVASAKLEPEERASLFGYFKGGFRDASH